MENEVFREVLRNKQDDDSEIEKIVLLQRLIRSYYVRRQFQQVKQEYLKTISDIDGEISIKPIEIIPTKDELPETMSKLFLFSLTFLTNCFIFRC